MFSKNRIFKVVLANWISVNKIWLYTNVSSSSKYVILELWGLEKAVQCQTLNAGQTLKVLLVKKEEAMLLQNIHFCHILSPSPTCHPDTPLEKKTVRYDSGFPYPAPTFLKSPFKTLTRVCVCVCYKIPKIS